MSVKRKVLEIEGAVTMSELEIVDGGEAYRLPKEFNKKWRYAEVVNDMPFAIGDDNTSSLIVAMKVGGMEFSGLELKSLLDLAEESFGEE